MIPASTVALITQWDGRLEVRAPDDVPVDALIFALRRCANGLAKELREAEVA